MTTKKYRVIGNAYGWGRSFSKDFSTRAEADQYAKRKRKKFSVHVTKIQPAKAPSRELLEIREAAAAAEARLAQGGPRQRVHGDAGQIHQVSRWIWPEEACKCAAYWREKGYQNVVIETLSDKARQTVANPKTRILGMQGSGEPNEPTAAEILSHE